mgnify:CR=1 FL=1
MHEGLPTERMERKSGTNPRDAAAAVRITVTAGRSRGHSVLISKPRVIVGRAETADVRLDDQTVSQFHMELGPTEDGIRVQDLDSRNGIFIGGVQIERALVPPGSSLMLGSTVLTVELAPGEAPPESAGRSFGPLVGEAPVMRQLYALLERLAPTELSVLIRGETGTGKELAARALHQKGLRAGRPFVVLDCTTIPTHLATSVLFGHERGAFTGAGERRIGVFEAAHGGVLFIDEVGELPLDQQPMLLRVLQQREIVPLGSTKPRPVDLRVIAASWRDLRAMVNKGTFREDLYYRLAQVTVVMPSLSERQTDIPLLVRHILSRLPNDLPAARDITDEAMAMLRARPFPGNIRELHSTVERLAHLASGPAITAADLAFERMLATARGGEAPGSEPPAASARSLRGIETELEVASRSGALEPFKEAKRTCIDEFEKTYLEHLLERTANNISQAAALAGLERHSLRELLRKHGLYQTKE